MGYKRGKLANVIRRIIKIICVIFALEIEAAVLWTMSPPELTETEGGNIYNFTEENCSGVIDENNCGEVVTQKTASFIEKSNETREATNDTKVHCAIQITTNCTDEQNDNYVTNPKADPNTYWVGADGHKICILHNVNAKDPTYEQMLDFIKADKTDKIQYKLDSFTCGDFAEQIQNNAEKAGYKCAWVSIDFDEGYGHAINAFNTTDRGMVFIDCTGGTKNKSHSISDTANFDCIVKVEIGKPYQPRFLFRSSRWYYEPMGIVKSYTVYWE